MPHRRPARRPLRRRGDGAEGRWRGRGPDELLRSAPAARRPAPRPAPGGRATGRPASRTRARAPRPLGLPGSPGSRGLPGRTFLRARAGCPRALGRGCRVDVRLPGGRSTTRLPSRDRPPPEHPSSGGRAAAHAASGGRRSPCPAAARFRRSLRALPDARARPAYPHRALVRPDRQIPDCPRPGVRRETGPPAHRLSVVQVVARTTPGPGPAPLVPPGPVLSFGTGSARADLLLPTGVRRYGRVARPPARGRPLSRAEPGNIHNPADAGPRVVSCPTAPPCTAAPATPRGDESPMWRNVNSAAVAPHRRLLPRALGEQGGHRLHHL